MCREEAFLRTTRLISVIRTLREAVTGGANGNCLMPTRNVKGCFFADMIVAYDASAIKVEDKSSILEEVHNTIANAMKMRCRGLKVHICGTQSAGASSWWRQSFWWRGKSRPKKKHYTCCDQCHYHPHAHSFSPLSNTLPRR